MKNLIILTGAGMSVESGLSTFRGSGGMWGKYPVEQVATIEGYYDNPELVINFYNDLRKQLLTVNPNHGHKVIAELEKYFNVTVITQNVDNLHERGGSSNVIHLHGELTKVTSSKDPNNPRYIETLATDDYDVKMGDNSADGSQKRPFIVWFGEAVPMIDEAIEWVRKADILVVIGTSLNVYPAAGLLNYLPPRVPIYVIDPNELPIKGSDYHFIQNGASKGMDELMKILLDKN